MSFAELQDGRTQITDMSLAVGKVSTGLPRRSNCWNSRVSGSNPTVTAILRYTSVSALTISQQTKLNSRTADHWIVSYPTLSSPTLIQHTHTHTHNTCFPAKSFLSKIFLQVFPTKILYACLFPSMRGKCSDLMDITEGVEIWILVIIYHVCCHIV